MSLKGNYKISVIMGIFNCETTLSESIDSILNQTYKNIELIMCDDGSADNTYKIASEYKEKYPDKIILIKNDKNMGLNFTLNRCLEVATGEFIARQDGDDVSLPERLEKELEILENNPEISIVSTRMYRFDENGIFGEDTLIECPQNLDFVKASPFNHATCLVRKEAYDAVDGYTVNPKLLRVEDYHLWSKMYALGYKGYNIMTPLYKMRDDRNAANRRKYKYRINEFYARWQVYKLLKLPAKYYVYAFRPLVVGLIPAPVYKLLHQKNLKEQNL